MSEQSVATDRPCSAGSPTGWASLDSYVDQSGGRCASRPTRRASGCSRRWGSTRAPRSARAGAARACAGTAQPQWIAPVRVVRQRSRAFAPRARARADAARARDPLDADAAHGGRHRAQRGGARCTAGRRVASARAARGRPPLGYHDLTIELEARRRAPHARRSGSSSCRRGARRRKRGCRGKRALRHHGEPLHRAQRTELGRRRPRRPHDARRVDRRSTAARSSA